MEQQRKNIVIAITNNKGGTGKTTVTLNLAAGLAAKNNRVLIIDIDPQANTSMGMGQGETQSHIGALLLGMKTWDEVLTQNPAKTLDFVPASGQLQYSEGYINGHPNRNFLLRDALEEVDYDYVLIDCPNGLGSLTINALTAAQYYIVPMQGENFPYQGLDNLLGEVNKLKRNVNPGLQLLGVVFNRYERTTFGREVLEALQREHIPVFDTVVRKDKKLMLSPAGHQSIFEYAPNTNGATDFAQLTDELLQRIAAHS